MRELILASSSPQRLRLLREAGYAPRVAPPSPEAEPDAIPGLSPTDLVVELARRKAEDVADRELRREAPRPGPGGAPQGDAGSGAAAGPLVLAADTVAECHGRVLGKPRDEHDAREMLTWMSGRDHRVLTGVCVAELGLLCVQFHAEIATTYLQMAALESGWLTPYLASGRWRGKAGAFGYQDGLEFVRIVRGSESNVVGLPLERVTQLLVERRCLPAEKSDP